MKISTNTIGNYTPAYIQKNNPAASQNESVQPETAKTDKVVLSSKEKQFFAKMYPDKTNEIMDYHFTRRPAKCRGFL